jgi:hypothetical protein
MDNHTKSANRLQSNRLMKRLMYHHFAGRWDLCNAVSPYSNSLLIRIKRSNQLGFESIVSIWWDLVVPMLYIFRNIHGKIDVKIVLCMYLLCKQITLPITKKHLEPDKTDKREKDLSFLNKCKYGNNFQSFFINLLIIKSYNIFSSQAPFKS